MTVLIAELEESGTALTESQFNNECRKNDYCMDEVMTAKNIVAIFMVGKDMYNYHLHLKAIILIGSLNGNVIYALLFE